MHLACLSVRVGCSLSTKATCSTCRTQLEQTLSYWKRTFCKSAHHSSAHTHCTPTSLHAADGLTNGVRAPIVTVGSLAGSRPSARYVQGGQPYPDVQPVGGYLRTATGPLAGRCSACRPLHLPVAQITRTMWGRPFAHREHRSLCLYLVTARLPPSFLATVDCHRRITTLPPGATHAFISTEKCCN